MSSIHREIVVVTTSAGTIAQNTRDTLRGVMRQVIAKPTTSTTIYDIQVKNNQDRIIYERTSVEGALAEEVAIPVYRTHTITISNATNDEEFGVELVLTQGDV